jgi:hypothetical protein
VDRERGLPNERLGDDRQGGRDKLRGRLDRLKLLEGVDLLFEPLSLLHPQRGSSGRDKQGSAHGQGFHVFLGSIEGSRGRDKRGGVDR